MKMPQLFKTNHNQPRCCHKTKDGGDCKATPQTNKQYCFFHDPEAQQKRAAARRAGGTIRQSQAAAQRPHFSVKPPQNPSDVIALVGELMDRVGQGSLDTRTANCIGHMSNIALSAMKFNFRMECEERKAARPDAARGSSAKKPPLKPLHLVCTDVYGREIYNSDPSRGSAPQPASAPVQPVKQDQGPQSAISPEPVESKKSESVEAAKPVSVVPPEAQPPLENKPKANGPSMELAADLCRLPRLAEELSRRVPAPASPAPPPVSSAAKHTEVRNEKDGVKVKNEINNKVRSEAGNESKNEVRQEQSFSGVPGLLPRHLNYLNYPELSGIPLQKKQRLPHCYVSSMSPRKMELMMEEARNRRRR